MLLTETVKVTAENGPRPAGKLDECFYCHQPIGAPHLGDCVCRERTVVVEVSVEILMKVPAFWGSSDISFSLNEGSRCADNSIGLIEQQAARFSTLTITEGCGSVGPCFCASTRHSFLREATEEDHERFAWCVPVPDSQPAYDWGIIAGASPFAGSQWSCESEDKARQFAARVVGRVVIRRTAAVDAGKWQFEAAPGHWADVKWEAPF
jgi:hypothetical protein